MKRFLKSFRHGQRGFTLIELLIVVAILGILAAVLIPNVTGFMKTGNVAAANTELENVKTASLAYYVDHNGTWPTDSDDLLDLTATPPADYIAGTLKAKYTFDTATGFITDGDPVETTGWTGIAWENPEAPTIGHGYWVKD